MKAQPQAPGLDELRLFDSCVTLGRFTAGPGQPCITADNAIGILDRLRIREALVHEEHARQIHPRERGNRRLLEAIKDMPRLHPAWVIEPPVTPGREAAADVVGEMLAAGVRAARFPLRHVPIHAWLWEELCAELEAHRIPCFFDFGFTATSGDLNDVDINGVRDVARAFPKLPIVLSHLFGGLGLHQGVVPLIHRTSNVMIDITGIMRYWRDIARDVGPDRVLFATGMPFAEPLTYVSNVQYARGLDAQAKKMICGDNLRRLIGAVT